ncbi:SDR family NAD(P)-dependent oxidoreductase [Tepidicella baoligensis]|uniref:SDR family NAD(P)-dependent oxidoreductase n=1 Tax=Tepidicella baoligensis TaxID=2707016 RepID=UPI0015DA43A4|nr:SDR family oxidoreductase [Tepidicella baoligensis]
MGTPEHVIVVTGASSGIGRSVAEALLAQGRRVINVDARHPEWTHPGLSTMVANLTDAADIRRVATELASSHPISALVNNAGATRPGTIDSLQTSDLLDLAHLHLLAPTLLTQALLPSLRSCKQGRIVNVASRAALGKPERIAYAATKAGLIGLTRTLAMELGRDGITVNAVAPGPIATKLFRQSNPPEAPQTQRILNSILVGRMGTPEDVSRAVLFFLSPDNGFVTGQVLYVCGGTTLGVAPG